MHKILTPGLKVSPNFSLTKLECDMTIPKVFFNFYFSWWLSCCNPKLGLITKVKAWEGNKEGECLKTLTHSHKYGEMSPNISWWFPHFGKESDNILNFWDKSLNNKWYPNQAIFKLLKMSWNLNIENGFPFSIWRSKVQVMNKRIAKNETGNLTPNHPNTKKKVRNTFD